MAMEGQCLIGRSMHELGWLPSSGWGTKPLGTGDVLPRTLLAEGFRIDGVRVPLLGPQGIFKPHVMSEVPLSITTAPLGPYDDSFGPDGSYGTVTVEPT